MLKITEYRLQRNNLAGEYIGTYGTLQIAVYFDDDGVKADTTYQFTNPLFSIRLDKERFTWALHSARKSLMSTETIVTERRQYP